MLMCLIRSLCGRTLLLVSLQVLLALKGRLPASALPWLLRHVRPAVLLCWWRGDHDHDGRRVRLREVLASDADDGRGTAPVDAPQRARSRGD